MGSGDRRLVKDWCRAGLLGFAGYAAWLVADAWAAEGNDSRAGNVIDEAIQLGGQDPRLLLAYGQRLAAQQRNSDVDTLVAATMASRNTDSAWDDLADWYDQTPSRHSHAYAGPWPEARCVDPHRTPRGASPPEALRHRGPLQDLPCQLVCPEGGVVPGTPDGDLRSW